MSSSSRFTSQAARVSNDRLSTQTVGLVHLSDFRKRRTEVIEAQEREARESLLNDGKADANKAQTLDMLVASASESAYTTDLADGCKLKKKRKAGKVKLSFDDGEENDDSRPVLAKKKKTQSKAEASINAAGSQPEGSSSALPSKPTKFNPNNGVVAPRIITKTSQKREAAERDELRREFLVLQDAIKNAEIAIPFVFYDGTNLPGGVVRVRKGDFSWVFLDKSRKVGAALAAGAKTTSRKDWARVGVDDLILVRGTVIIPHHYDFYYFIMNKTTGPGQKRLFDFSAEAPKATARTAAAGVSSDIDDPSGSNEASTSALATPSSSALKAAVKTPLPDISTLEGASDDPFFTKVVDRRWYERNKHIYPASTWQEYDAEKDYGSEIKRDTGGNAFFYA
ncbi:FAM50 family protein.12c [Ceratocystis platani]|uniref:FAM50 family protein.12c n=1 Tax=Ceratocystis fimbriata f. sp. platani TaxID=88771 RepID=A0A0F8CQ17_CERFI|nr:FAM50 family protein.12c [Ceratocystis platani]